MLSTEPIVQDVTQKIDPDLFDIDAEIGELRDKMNQIKNVLTSRLQSKFPVIDLYFEQIDQAVCDLHEIDVDTVDLERELKTLRAAYRKVLTSMATERKKPKNLIGDALNDTRDVQRVFSTLNSSASSSSPASPQAPPHTVFRPPSHIQNKRKTKPGLTSSTPMIYIVPKQSQIKIAWYRLQAAIQSAIKRLWRSIRGTGKRLVHWVKGLTWDNRIFYLRTYSSLAATALAFFTAFFLMASRSGAITLAILCGAHVILFLLVESGQAGITIYRRKQARGENS